MRVLLINTNKERLHYYEFVKPIEDIIRKDGSSFFTKYYSEVKKIDLDSADKVVICGTSLRDFGYIENVGDFDWLRDFDKPVLGICAGMQILYFIFKGNAISNRLKDQLEIGFREVRLKESILGLQKDFQAYFLHNLGVKKNVSFDIIGTTSSGIAVVKHVSKPFYGVLFHPEVRQKQLIEEFVKNG